MKAFSLYSLLLIGALATAQVKYIDMFDGTKLCYEDSGQGQTLLFITGWTMTYKFFDNQKDHFAATNRVVTYDPRGQGRSDKTTYKNTYADHAADLQELMEQLELEDVVLIGWSSGCLTIYEYLRAFGNERISKLIFIDEPPKWVGNKETEWVYGTFDGYRSSLKGMISKPSDPDGIINWMLNDPIEPETLEWMRKEILMTPPHVALSLYIDGLVSDYNQEVRSLEKPALFLVRDDWYDYARAWLRKNSPVAEVKAISSHAMFWERPTTFNQILADFINNN